MSTEPDHFIQFCPKLLNTRESRHLDEWIA